jgi:hypothetical protein
VTAPGSGSSASRFLVEDYRIDFDPTGASREKSRSGPRWYSVIAFLVIAFLLAVNALAMFVNAAAKEEEACYTRVNASAMSGFSDTQEAFWECDKRFERGGYAPPSD